ncbi:MAG: hypothetical protein JO155_03135 [Acidimicrobiia bacterium]|nr:hypothetical protein [Acidimicrobiia bacterium]
MDWTSIVSFAHLDSGITSVGLKAVAFVRFHVRRTASNDIFEAFRGGSSAYSNLIIAVAAL